MVHTLPPWTTKYRMVKVFGQIDSGELAARLGAISLQDRRGNVLSFDDCTEEPNKWIKYYVGTGGGIFLSTDRPLFDGASYKIICPSDHDGDAYILKRFPTPVNGNIGIEYLICIYDEIDWIRMLWYHYSGSQFHEAKIKLDIKNSQILYYSYDDADYVWFTDWAFYTGGNAYQSFKLVINSDTGKYVRFVMPNIEYDLSSYNIRKRGSDITPNAATSLYVYGNDGVNGVIYVGGFILTQNEP